MTSHSSPELRAVTSPRKGRDEAKRASAPGLIGLAMLERYADGAVSRDEALIAVEEPLLISVSGGGDFVVPRTPGDDRHLILGHLFSLGLIQSAEDVLHIETGEDRAEVTLGKTRTACRTEAFPDRFRLTPERIFQIRAAFEARQRLYRSTGSTHAAGLFRADGELLAYGEDVSRHCALDKAVGRALVDDALNLADVAMLTSRLARELAVKTARAGIPVLCGFSAATSAGMEYASGHGLTLIGRVRPDSFNVYANGWRMEY